MTNAALRTIFPIAGWGEERARAVEITGGTDPIFLTSFRIAETSAAALAATGLAVSDLWQLRTGLRQKVAVDRRQATASLRSGHYMKLNGAPVSTERNARSEEHTSELQSLTNLVCRLLLEKKKKNKQREYDT